MGDKKEKKRFSKKHKKERKAEKKKKIKTKSFNAEELNDVEKKPTSDQILESLFNDVKNAAKPIDITTLINKEKKEELKISTETNKDIFDMPKRKKSSKKKKKKKDRRSLSQDTDIEYVLTLKKKRVRTSSRNHSRNKSRTRTRSPSFSRSRSTSTGRFRSSTSYKKHSSSRSRSRHRLRSPSRSRSRSQSHSLGRFCSSTMRRFGSSSTRFKQSPRRFRSSTSHNFGRFKRFQPFFKRRFIGRNYVDEYGKIDKEKLLEIATKNATKLAMEGKLPKGVELVDSMKNKTINELVTICKQLHEEEGLMEKVSSDEEDYYDDRYSKSKKLKQDCDDDEFVSKPVRLASEIKINIPNANALPTTTPQQRMANESALQITFPVSSGARHRNKMEWISIARPADESVGPLTSALSKIKTNIPAAYKPPPEPPNDIFSSLIPPVKSLDATFEVKLTPYVSLLPPPVPPKVEAMEIVDVKPSYSNSLFTLPVCLPPPPPPPIMKPSRVLQTPTIQELLAKRVTYSNRLKDDPNDYNARRNIASIDEEMSAWAQNSNEQGKFLGSTGAKVLSAEELGPKNPKFQAWIKKDIFKKAPEVSSGVGMKLLQKMGWQPGEGLGKDGAGSLLPLSLDIKSDRKGLQSVEDRRMSKRESVVDPTGKNPVSIVMEYCSKKKISPPDFTCLEIDQAGTKRFLWKAILSGVEYQPSLPSSNKKAAKSQVCLVMLEALGLGNSLAPA